MSRSWGEVCILKCFSWLEMYAFVHGRSGFSGLLIATDFGSIMNDSHLAQRYDDVTHLFLSDQYPWPSNKFFFG